MSRARGFLANILGEQTGGILGSPVSALPQTQAPPAPTGQAQPQGNRLFQNPAFLSALNSFGQALVQPGQVPGQAINTGQRLAQGLGAFNQQFGQQQQLAQAQQQQKAQQQAKAEADLRAEAFKEREVALKEKEFGLNVREFEQKALAGGLDPKELFNRGTKLRGEFTSLSKDFIKQRDAFGRVQASAEDPSPAGDLALIFNFMKVLDPGSTVREGEFATAANSASVPERLRGVYNKIIAGERLTVKQRGDFVTRSGKLFDEAEGQHGQRVEQFTSLSTRLGVDPQNVVLDLGVANRRAQEEQAQESVPIGQSVLQQTPIPQQFTPAQIQTELKRRGL